MSISNKIATPFRGSKTLPSGYEECTWPQGGVNPHAVTNDTTACYTPNFRVGDTGDCSFLCDPATYG